LPHGSLSDINVLPRCHLFYRLASGDALVWNYNVNDHDYTIGYYLADDIYPSWLAFVKTIQHPKTNKECVFFKAQEACRKDIKRIFCVFQAMFSIVQGAGHLCDKKFF
jgi:hypothetical protein